MFRVYGIIVVSLITSIIVNFYGEMKRTRATQPADESGDGAFRHHGQCERQSVAGTFLPECEGQRLYREILTFPDGLSGGRKCAVKKRLP